MANKLPYFLMDNVLTPDPLDHRAVTMHKKVNTIDDVINMIAHRNVGISRSQIMSVIEEEFIALEFMLRRGKKIVTPLFTISPTVTSVFRDRHDGFDRNRHNIKLNVYAGQRLQHVTNEIEVKKVTAPKTVPILESFYDVITKTSDTQATQGQPAKILGENLRVDPEDVAQGIYFTTVGTNEEFAVDTIIDVKPREVSFMVPDTLAPGDYLVSVKAKIKKEVMRAELPTPISVS